MTLSEAISLIDKECLDLAGSEWSTDEVLGAVGRYHGEEYDLILADFEQGKLGNQEYCDVMIHLIREYAKVRFRLQVEKELAALRRAV